MKDVLEFILKNITTVPDDVVIEEREEEGGTNYVITVNPADVGRIIGKEGKVIKAIRTIMRVIAIQKGVRVRVSVMSDDKENMSETQVPGSENEVTVTEESTPAPEAVTEAPVETPVQVADADVPVSDEVASDDITVEV